MVQQNFKQANLEVIIADLLQMCRVAGCTTAQRSSTKMHTGEMHAVLNAAAVQMPKPDARHKGLEDKESNRKQNLVESGI